MEKGFNPFDERHLNKQKKRKPSEVVYEQKQWEDRIDKHFRRVLENLDWPDYVSSEQITSMLFMEEMTVPFEALRRNFPGAMDRLEYDKLKNPKTKDGRWSFGKIFTFAYKKRSAPEIEKTELKQQLGM